MMKKKVKIRYDKETGRALNGPFEGYPKMVIGRFSEFHRNNPKVFKLFKHYAMEMRNSGRERYSAEIIINRIRWHYDIETKGKPFKINNDFKPLYARLLVYRYPEFEGFFNFRKVTSCGIKSDYERELLGE